MYCFQKANGLLININNYEKTFEWHFINTLPRGRIRHTFKLDIHFLSPRSVRVAIVWLGLVKHYPISRQDLEKKRGQHDLFLKSLVNFSLFLIFLCHLPTFSVINLSLFSRHSDDMNGIQLTNLLWEWKSNEVIFPLSDSK